MFKIIQYPLFRTIVFTIGHFFIDITTGYIITGAPIHLIAVSAFLSPVINAVWYYVLDRFFFSRILKSIQKNV